MGTLTLTLWRDQRVQRFLQQALFVALLTLLGVYLVDRARDLDLGFGFLDGRAGFGIGDQWVTSFSGDNSRLDAYVVGVSNTVRIAAVGIVLASVVGLLVGVARLSNNWLVSRLAAVYVEIIRNIPLLVQIIFWYIAVILQLPKIEDSISAGDVAFLSVRGLALPWVTTEGGFGLWLIVLALAAFVAFAVRSARRRRQERTGRPSYPNGSALLTFVLIAVVAFAAIGGPLSFDQPRLAGRSYAGGLQMSPEFAGVFVALVLYTGAFIAEIVRGSIQSVSKGQTEAAEALGLSGFQRLTMVILPQALRVMIPPVTSQYLNLTKNSSLAVAIAFPELVTVSRTIMNNTGQLVPMFVIIMASYLLMSLLISVIMNTLHWRLTRAGH